MVCTQRNYFGRYYCTQKLHLLFLILISALHLPLSAPIQHNHHHQSVPTTSIITNNNSTLITCCPSASLYRWRSCNNHPLPINTVVLFMRQDKHLFICGFYYFYIFARFCISDCDVTSSQLTCIYIKIHIGARSSI